MAIKEWIAEKLCPKAFADQRSYYRMKAEAADAHWWLNGYPDAADALRWILDNDRNQRRAIGEPAVGALPSDIGSFRDILERRHLTTPAQRKEQEG
jgi:hypothetical protein